MIPKFSSNFFLVIILILNLTVTNISVYSLEHSFLAPPGFSGVLHIDNKKEEIPLETTDIGTAGTHNAEFIDRHIKPRIKSAIKNGRFTRIIYDKGELQFDVAQSGKKATNPDSHSLEKLIHLNQNKKLQKFFEEYKELTANLSIFLLESIDGTTHSIHPHCLSAMGKQFSIAFSGTHHGTERAIYMTRSAFMDFNNNLLADIICNQAVVSTARFTAWHKGSPYPVGTSSEKASNILRSIRRIEFIKKELKAFHMHELKVSKEYAIEPAVCTLIVSLWKRLHDEFPDLSPIGTNYERAQKFEDAISQHDYDSAITWWGLITYEMHELKNRLKLEITSSDVKERIKLFFDMNQVNIFSGLAEGINKVFNRYIEKYGIHNQEGEEPGKAVGIVKVIKDIKKIGEAFDKAIGNEIWVIPYLPFRRSEIPGIGCIMSVAGNRHTIDTAKEQGIPLAVIPNAEELLKNFNNEQGMLRVAGDKEVRFRKPFPNERSILQERRKHTVKVPKARIGSAYFYNLADSDSNFISYVGPKAANLGEMISAGINVPPGFVCSFTFWDKFRQFNKLDAKIEKLRKQIAVENRKIVTDTEQFRNILEEIKQLIINGTFPENLQQKLFKNINKFRSTYGRVSFYIRSSFNFEDLLEKTTAGHYESLPNKHFLDTSTDDNILMAIKMVFASKWNEIAFRARINDDIPDKDVLPAVIIQVPIKGKVAGTMYTANHVSKSLNEISLLASHGQGESVVSELGKPAEVTVNKLTGTVKLIQDTSLINTEFQSKGNHFEIVFVTPEERESVIFTPELIEILKENGEKIESLFHFIPQDIEWCMDESGTVWFVQTRPMETGKQSAEMGVEHRKLDLFAIINEKTLHTLKKAQQKADISILFGYLNLNISTKEAFLLKKQAHAERVVAAEYLSLIADNIDAIGNISIENINQLTTFLNATDKAVHNCVDSYSIPELLIFLRKVGLQSKDEKIQNLIRIFFTQLATVNTKPFFHRINFEIANALIEYKQFDRALSKLREADNITDFPDIADGTIRILGNIPTSKSIKSLEEFCESDAMPDWIKEYALRIIDRIKDASSLPLPEPDQKNAKSITTGL